MPGNESKLFVLMEIFYHVPIQIATGFLILVKNGGKFCLSCEKCLNRFAGTCLLTSGGEIAMLKKMRTRRLLL